MMAHVNCKFLHLAFKIVSSCSRALPGVGLPRVGERQAALYGALRCFSRSRNRPLHCAGGVLVSVWERLHQPKTKNYFVLDYNTI